jgi:hypothetical protein
MHKDRSGHLANSNTLINDTDDTVHADKHVSLQKFELAFNLPCSSVSDTVHKCPSYCKMCSR